MDIPSGQEDEERLAGGGAFEVHQTRVHLVFPSEVVTLLLQRIFLPAVVPPPQ